MVDVYVNYYLIYQEIYASKCFNHINDKIDLRK